MKADIPTASSAEQAGTAEEPGIGRDRSASTCNVVPTRSAILDRTQQNLVGITGAQLSGRLGEIEYRGPDTVCAQPARVAAIDIDPAARIASCNRIVANARRLRSGPD